MGDVGLTPFLLAMIRTPVDRLTRADPARLAAKYEIPADTAAFYLQAWVNR